MEVVHTTLVRSLVYLPTRTRTLTVAFFLASPLQCEPHRPVLGLSHTRTRCCVPLLFWLKGGEGRGLMVITGGGVVMYKK